MSLKTRLKIRTLRLISKIHVLIKWKVCIHRRKRLTFHSTQTFDVFVTGFHYGALKEFSDKEEIKFRGHSVEPDEGCDAIKGGNTSGWQTFPHDITKIFVSLTHLSPSVTCHQSVTCLSPAICPFISVCSICIHSSVWMTLSKKDRKRLKLFTGLYHSWLRLQGYISQTKSIMSGWRYFSSH